MTPLLLLLGVLLDTMFGIPLAVSVSTGESLVDLKSFLNFAQNHKTNIKFKFQQLNLKLRNFKA